MMQYLWSIGLLFIAKIVHNLLGHCKSDTVVVHVKFGVKSSTEIQNFLSLCLKFQ